MVAEPIQITSLQRAPEGWVFSEETRSRRQMSSRPSQPDPLNPYSARYTGRPDHSGQVAIPRAAADLPELTPGISKLPTSCTHCGSAFLTTEPALDTHRRGMVTCNTCGSQVCWLRPSLDMGPRMPMAFVTPASERPHPSPGPRPVRPAVPNMFDRLDGCGVACSIAFGHDPKTHELYGRERALAELESRPAGQVRTGRLTVDLDAARALVGGADIGLSATEMKVIACLAGRLGQVVPHDDVVTAAWDTATFRHSGTFGHGDGVAHLVRVNVARIRAKLGPASRLIETRSGFGYMLRAEPPTGDVS